MKDNDSFVKLLVKYQLALVGLDYSITEEKDWYSKYSIDKTNYEKWKVFCIDKIRKYLKCSEKTAKKEFIWIDFSFGLKLV
jgi:hypothetical protein